MKLEKREREKKNDVSNVEDRMVQYPFGCVEISVVFF